MADLIMQTSMRNSFIYGETVIHPIALGFTLLMGVLIIVLPRRYIYIPLLLATIFIPIQQRVVIATLDLFMLRILILFGWLRLLVRSEIRPLKINMIDILMILWTISRLVTYSLLWKTDVAFLNRLGISFDALGMYFLFRFFIKDFIDIERIIKAFLPISVLLAIFMLIERVTGQNLFSIFGGVPEITVIRDNQMRCQGAFAHPILAGSFGAALFPLFVGLFRQGLRNKQLAIICGLAALIVTGLTSSSGPILSLATAIIGLTFWPTRHVFRYVIWGGLCLILAVQMLMDAPIWALFWRLTVFGASTGYHRFLIFDQFINHFNEWWLLGTQSTNHWGYSLFDVTNQYVRIGVDGGIITLLLFLGIIISCFLGLGKAFGTIQNQPARKFLLWGLGVSMFTHLVSFWGVAYFDQVIVLWYMSLALCAQIDNMATANELNPITVTEEIPENVTLQIAH